MSSMDDQPSALPPQPPEPPGAVPPPVVPPYVSPRTHERSRLPWALSEILAWVVIVLAVAFGVWRTAAEKSAAAARPVAAGGGGEAKLQMLMMSRYAIGVHEMLKLVGRAPASGPASAPAGGGGAGSMLATESQQMLEQVDKVATAPEDQLRAAIIHGEYEGPAEAIRRLQAAAERFPEVAGDAMALQDLYAGTPSAAAPAGPVAVGVREKYGWFADLAASAGRPDADPARAAVLTAGLWTVAAMLGAVFVGFGGGAVGLILLIIAIVLLARGRITLAFDRLPAASPAGATYRPLPPDRRAYLQGFTLYLVGMMAFGMILRYVLAYIIPGLPRMLSAASLPVAFLAGALWPLFRGQRLADWAAATGFHRGRGWVREILAGWLGYLVGFPIFVAGALITMLLVKVSGADASHPLTQELSGGPILLLLLLAAAWAPVTEELMFRGMLFAHLRQRFGWWASAIVVALVFAVIHPQGWAGVPALASLALVFAGIREWRGSIVGCMAAHALHNGMAVVFMWLMLG